MVCFVPEIVVKFRQRSHGEGRPAKPRLVQLGSLLHYRPRRNGRPDDTKIQKPLSDHTKKARARAVALAAIPVQSPCNPRNPRAPKPRTRTVSTILKTARSFDGRSCSDTPRARTTTTDTIGGHVAKPQSGPACDAATGPCVHAVGRSSVSNGRAATVG